MADVPELRHWLIGLCGVAVVCSGILMTLAVSTNKSLEADQKQIATMQQGLSGLDRGLVRATTANTALDRYMSSVANHTRLAGHIVTALAYQVIAPLAPAVRQSQPGSNLATSAKNHLLTAIYAWTRNDQRVHQALKDRRNSTFMTGIIDIEYRDVQYIILQASVLRLIQNAVQTSHVAQVTRRQNAAHSQGIAGVILALATAAVLVVRSSQPHRTTMVRDSMTA